MGSLEFDFFRRPTWSTVAIALLGFSCAGWATLDLLRFDIPAAVQRAWPYSALAVALNFPETRTSGLPPAPENGYWDGIAGLNVKIEGTGPDAVMHLTAIGSDRHHFNFDVRSLPASTTFRVSAEVQPGPTGSGNVMLEVRDSLTSEGRPTHYSVVYFDLGKKHLSAASGQEVPSGIDPGPDEWDKIWVEQQTADGAVFIMLALFDDQNGLAFRNRDREVRVRRLSITPLSGPVRK
jgi:hypothetical protein